MKHVEKEGSILWDILKTFSILSVKLKQKKRFNLLRHIQFFESCWKRFSSYSRIFFWKKKGSILWFENVSILWVICWNEGSILWVKNFDRKKSSILWVIFWNKEQLVRWVIYWSKKKKGSILWVMLKRTVQFCESCFFFLEKFNSLSHILKRAQVIESYFFKRAQFFESYKKNQSSILWVISFFFQKLRFNSLRHISKESSKFWIIFEKKVQVFESHSKKEVQFLESHSKFNSWSHIQKRFNSLSRTLQKGSILWVILKKEFNSLSHFLKGFNSLSHTD